MNVMNPLSCWKCDTGSAANTKLGLQRFRHVTEEMIKPELVHLYHPWTNHLEPVKPGLTPA